MSELFPAEAVTAESPKLKWMRLNGVQTLLANPDADANAEDDLGNAVHKWHAWSGPTDFANAYAHHKAGGNTEDDAIVQLALKRGWKLWNEGAKR